MKFEEATKGTIHNSMSVITLYHLLIRWTAIRTVNFQSTRYIEYDKTSETCA